MKKSLEVKAWFIEYGIMFGLCEERYYQALISAEWLRKKKLVSESEWRSMVRLANAGLIIYEKPHAHF